MISKIIDEIKSLSLTPLDLLPQQDLREKVIDLILRGVPGATHSKARSSLNVLRKSLLQSDVDTVKVVVFGGGTGLSNIIGGDSRLKDWTEKPFGGLKSIFPTTRSIVCVTDNGGSTGELLKDLPLVAIGDMRHVLLSAIQLSKLQQKYSIDSDSARKTAALLADAFNWRFDGPLTEDYKELIEKKTAFQSLPSELSSYLLSLMETLFTHDVFSKTLQRDHCFGNLILAAAIYQEVGRLSSHEGVVLGNEILHIAIEKGMNKLALALGAGERAVMPCTSTPAQLKVIYSNGVSIRGEHKLEKAKREFPVESVEIEYCGEVRVHENIIKDISEADIIILAPGSLYSSIIPVFKVPGLAEAVRKNQKALKILVSNLWVQAGETDVSIVDPTRKFHVSDMIGAYEKNIPGGTEGLFNEVLCISLKEIPASTLQNYAVEGKVPIYLDKEALTDQKYIPIECGVYSEDALLNRNVIQHDPDTLALAIKGLYEIRNCFPEEEGKREGKTRDVSVVEDLHTCLIHPCKKLGLLKETFTKLDIQGATGDKNFDRGSLVQDIIGILWDHPIIPLSHFRNVSGIHCIDVVDWNRDQQWDNVFSFYDPDDRLIKIRADQIYVRNKLEIALMIAIGESLLGDYAAKKVMHDVVLDTIFLGKTYFLYLKDIEKTFCYFNEEQLRTFLILSKMCSTEDKNLYTRLVNKEDSFTAPGLLMGLIYTWYVDNRLATHIEYKMSVLKISQNDLIPAQLEMVEKRQEMIKFFREIVFKE